MNYRHGFHAGNFADAFKHALLLPLIAGMQRKEKGFLFLDTHAGAGRYDLALEIPGRTPEYPEGIGQLWSAKELTPLLKNYVEEVRAFGGREGCGREVLRFYPGSPCLGLAQLRPQDRAAFCELHPEDLFTLRRWLGNNPQARLERLDGYTGLRGFLPPLERRALVLIDPPFEAQDEFAKITAGIRAGLARLPSAVIAIWYPISERADGSALLETLQELRVPTVCIELRSPVSSENTRLSSCGLLVINPPWQFDIAVKPELPEFAKFLTVGGRGSVTLEWLVPEA